MNQKNYTPKAFLLSVALHGSVLAAAYFTIETTKDIVIAKEKTIMMDLQTLAPSKSTPVPIQKEKVKQAVEKKVEQKLEKRVEEKPKKPEKKIEKPKPKLKEEPKPKEQLKKPTPKPKPKNVIKNPEPRKEPLKTISKEVKKEKKKIEVKKEEPKKNQPKKEPVLKQNNVLKTNSNEVYNNNRKKASSKGEQIKYFNKIKTLINKNKTYPKMALRRGIEGKVKVKLQISKDGELLNIINLDGHKLFKKSIKKNINSIFPIKPEKELFESDQIIEFEVIYSII